MRFGSRLKYTLPTVAALLARLVQLAVLFLLAYLGAPDERAVLIAGFGLLGAFTILTDSGATNFLLASDPRSVSRPVYNRVIAFHGVLGLGGAVAALAFTAFTNATSLPLSTGVILSAIALAQVIDSATRSIRAPLLLSQRDAAFSIPDFAAFGLKSIVLAIALLTGDLVSLIGLPMASAVVALGTYLRVRMALQPGGQSPPKLYRRVLEFGVTGAMSAFYSQSPLVAGALLLPVSQVAILAIVYRLAQPLELIPGTVAQQLLPRIRAGRLRPVRLWAIFLLSGSAAALILFLLQPLINVALAGQITSATVFWIVLGSVPVKWGNYLLVTVIMALGFIRERLIVTVTVGILAIVLCVSLAQFAAQGIALVSIISEAALAVGLAVVLIRGKRVTA